MNNLFAIIFGFLPTFIVPIFQIISGIPYSLGFTIRLTKGKWNPINILLIIISIIIEIYGYIIAISTSILILNKFIIKISFLYYFIGILITLFFVRFNFISTTQKRKQWEETKELNTTKIPIYVSTFCLYFSVILIGILLFKPEFTNIHFDWAYELIKNIIPERR